MADGSQCNADGIPGICDRGLCEPGCGDGVTDPNEQCDDGNFASHDGCSSECQVEEPTWAAIPQPWTGLYQHAAAFSASLDRIVVFGGQTANGISGRTWQRDPAQTSTASAGWSEVTATFNGMQPPPRDQAMMTYDSARGVIVLFGGADAAGNPLGDTWEYGPKTPGDHIGVWTQTTPSGSPPARFAAGMVYDEAIGKTVLFGGNDANGLISPGETWAYDGTTWTQLSPPMVALTSSDPSMAYDSTRGVVVLFELSGTWEFDGTTWRQPVLSGAPPTRIFASLAYDPSRQKVVLFGGQDFFGTTYSDTWTYDGAWTELAFSNAPEERHGAALAADPVNSVLVLVGGVRQLGDLPDEVWELSTNFASKPVWTPALPSFQPPAADRSNACYDTASHSLYVYGGRNAAQTQLPDLWRFDGQQWMQLPDGPRARGGHAMAYDPVRDRVVVFGGYCSVTCPSCSPDCGKSGARTLEYDPTMGTWTDTDFDLGSGLGRVDAAMAYDAVDHEVVLFGGRSNFTDAVLTDTWTYDGTTWTQLSGSGPAATDRPAMGWDPGLQAVIVFDLVGATWQFQHGAWSLLIGAATTGPVGRFGAGLSYDVQRKRFMLVGGQSAAGDRLTDVWELDAAAATWTRVYVPGDSPLPRALEVFAPFSNGREHVFYGGVANATTPLGDVWRVKYSSATPDEICDDGIDNDGDHLVDAADPDCAPL